MPGVWHSLGVGRFTGIDWGAAPSAAVFDPYVAWLEATRLPGDKSLPPDGHVPLALEIEPSKRNQFFSEAVAADNDWLRVPAAYAPQGVGNFCTARVRLTELARLQSIGVKRVDLGLVSKFAEQSALRRVLRRMRQAFAGLFDAPQPEAVSDAPVMLAVIDHGCAYAHRQFRRVVANNVATNGTRLRWFWDQGSDESAPPVDFAYGSEWRGAELNAEMGKRLGPKDDFLQDGERACYRFNGAELPDLERGWHGTHVLDLLGGRVDPLGAATDPIDEAGRADLMFVNLPPRAISDVSGGWLSVHVLDAVRYVVSRVPADQALVINLSLGAHAGGHDGQSILESAIDSMLQVQRPMNTVVSLAAGNAYAMDTHASLTLGTPGTAAAEAELVWDVPSADQTDSFLEIWLPADAQVEVSVIPPSGSALPWLPEGAWVLLADGDDGRAAAMVLKAPAVSTGSGSMILVALGPTTAAPDFETAAAEEGVWQVRLRNVGQDDVPVDAWIERDDPASSPFSSGRQSVFRTHQSSQSTLSSIACGQHTVVVAASTRANHSVASFSSAGPTRGARTGPDLIAPGEHDVQSADSDDGGLVAAGVFSGQTVEKRGTSMAAPVFARAAANILAARTSDMTTADVMAKLTATVASPDPTRGALVLQR